MTVVEKSEHPADDVVDIGREGLLAHQVSTTRGAVKPKKCAALDILAIDSDEEDDDSILERGKQNKRQVNCIFIY